MLSAADVKPGNQILNALPPSEFRDLEPHLKRVEMPLGKIIYDVGEPIDYIYFPETSIISTVSFFEDGASIETGITGREGMTGFGFALSEDVAHRETSVQAEGFGWQMPSKTFKAAFESGGSLQHLVLRYVYAYLEQISQSGACINHHPVNQRLARWLLMCHDRTDGNKLQITHDFIAQMLGVNRPSVTGAAIELKDEGLNTAAGSLKLLTAKVLKRFHANVTTQSEKFTTNIFRCWNSKK
jgi:CRP-like cAMP-binding protein